MRADNYQKQVKIVVSTAPATEPISVAEAKTHLRIDHTDDDTLLGTYIQAARELVEAFTGRRMITRTEKLFLDDFPPCDGIVIPVAPVRAVDSVKTYDDADAATTFAASNYVTDLNGHVGAVVLKSTAAWPALAAAPRPINAVEVQFQSGYASAAAVPEAMKLAVKLLVGHMYENREATSPLTIQQIPLGIRHILTQYVVWEAKV